PPAYQTRQSLTGPAAEDRCQGGGAGKSPVSSGLGGGYWETLPPQEEQSKGLSKCKGPGARDATSPPVGRVVTCLIQPPCTEQGSSDRGLAPAFPGRTRTRRHNRAPSRPFPSPRPHRNWSLPRRSLPVAGPRA